MADLTRTQQRKLIARVFEQIVIHRDPYSQHHGTHTSHIANNFAKELELSATERTLLRVGAEIHDLGKLVIAENVINKAGDLSPSEYAMIQSHSTFGFKIAQALELGPTIEEIIYLHHERWDGLGYPNGLKGNETPIHARIVQISDIIDALMTDRSYRSAHPIQKAIAIMRDEEFKYDPELLRLLIRNVKKWI